MEIGLSPSQVAYLTGTSRMEVLRRRKSGEIGGWTRGTTVAGQSARLLPLAALEAALGHSVPPERVKVALSLGKGGRRLQDAISERDSQWREWCRAKGYSVPPGEGPSP